MTHSYIKKEKKQGKIMEIHEKYDVILQNNASKETFLYPGVEDMSESHLYHEFEVEIDAPDGEYTYVLLKNSRDDVEYTFRTPILDTIVAVDGEEYLLEYFQPATGLLKIGVEATPVNIYDKKKENNDTIFYYE